MFIAHRGVVNKTTKENSLEAFNLAIKDDYYAGFELDIYTSLDGYFVVNHNPIVGGKLIWKTKRKDLQKRGIIDLEEVLKLDTDKVILIEIKDINIDIDKLTKLLNKYSYKKIYVMSFFNSVIRQFKNHKFKVGVLNYILNTEVDYKYNFIGLLYDIVTVNLIEAYKREGIEVFIYAINKRDKYLFQGVYYIVDNW